MAGKEASAPLPLSSRILAVMEDLAPIEATGKTPFDKAKPALSIGDVEKALRPLLVKYGITIWPMLIELTQAGGLWRADLSFQVEGDTSFVANWADVGSSPSAAMSFCRKSFYKALFHIADMDESDDVPKTPTPLDPAPAKGARSAATSKAPAEGRAPGDPGALSLKMAHEVEYLYRLGDLLPSPATHEQVSHEIEMVGMEKVRTRLRAAHLGQCGLTCPHIEVG